MGTRRRDRHAELHHAGHDRGGLPARDHRQGVRAGHPARSARGRRAARARASTRSTRCSATAAIAPRTPEEVKEAQGYGGSDDWIVMPLQCVTQWDSLAHIFYEGKMWNGYGADLVTSSGAAKNSIDKTNSKLAGRGVLLDVARHKGVRALEPGYAITVADLEATAAAAEGRGQARRSPAGADRPHDPLPRQEGLAPLRPRRLPRHVDPHDAVAARQADRGHRLRQLRGGGPALGDRRPSATRSTWWPFPTWG